MKHIKNFLLDMDGTLYLGDHIFECTSDFLNGLSSAGRRYLFLTNNSSRSVKEYLGKLDGMGLHAAYKDVFTSSLATMIYLRKIGGQKIFLMACDSVEQEFLEAGFILNEDNPEYVVLCFDKTLTYQKLEAACNLIQRGAKFIATHPDNVCPTETLPIPDAGAMIKLIETATNVSPKVIGKPNVEMIESALSKLNAKPEETAIVGDRIYTDMEMGFRAGLTTVLVLSGEASIEDVQNAARKPDYVLDSVADIVGLI